jgi:hypothetical protein
VGKSLTPSENCSRHQMIPPVPEFRPNRTKIYPTGDCAGGLGMASKRTEIAIEKIVAACDGNVHGALEALLLVNEHLEAELHQLYAAISRAPRKNPRFKRVH